MAESGEKMLRDALQYALSKRGTPLLSVKPKQWDVLKALVVKKRDVLAILPTGYGKSLIYQLLPDIFNFVRETSSSIVLVVSPLTALIRDQVDRLKSVGLKACIFRHAREENVATNEANDFEFEGDFDEASVIFAHPEVLTGSKKCREVLLSDKFQENVVCVVADEAHCIVDWYVVLHFILFFVNYSLNLTLRSRSCCGLLSSYDLSFTQIPDMFYCTCINL